MVHIHYEEFMNSEKGIVLPGVKKHVTFREITIVCLTIIFAFSAAACCIVLVVSHTPDTVTTAVINVNVTKVCTTQSCFLSAAKLVALRDSAADPCDNFYKYACGNWQKYEPKSALHPDQREKSIFHLMQERSEESIQKIMDTPSKAGARGYEVKIKSFYADCLDDYAKSIAGAKPFIDNVLKLAGGWNAVPAETGYNDQTYDIKVAMKKVHVDFWKDALFRVQVGGDWIDYTKNVIEVRNLVCD